MTHLWFPSGPLEILSVPHGDPLHVEIGVGGTQEPAGWKGMVNEGKSGQLRQVLGRCFSMPGKCPWVIYRVQVGKYSVKRDCAVFWRSGLSSSVLSFLFCNHCSWQPAPLKL